MPRLPPKIEQMQVVTELRQLRDALRIIFSNVGICSLFSFYSVSVHVLTTALVLIIAIDVGIDVDLVECPAIVPTSLLISSAPVSIAGWGLRESPMITGFAYVGMPASDALFLSTTLGLSMLFFSMLEEFYGLKLKHANHEVII